MNDKNTTRKATLNCFVGYRVNEKDLVVTGITNVVSGAGAIFSIGIVQRQLAKLLHLDSLVASLEKRGNPVVFVTRGEVPISDILGVRDGQVFIDRFPPKHSFCIEAIAHPVAETEGECKSDIEVSATSAEELEPQMEQIAKMFCDAASTHMREIVQKANELGPQSVFLGNAYVTAELFSVSTVISDSFDKSGFVGLTDEIVDALKASYQSITAETSETFSLDTDGAMLAELIASFQAMLESDGLSKEDIN